MLEIKLSEGCDIVLVVKMPDGSKQDQYLWTAAKGETLKLIPVLAGNGHGNQAVDGS